VFCGCVPRECVRSRAVEKAQRSSASTAEYVAADWQRNQKANTRSFDSGFPRPPHRAQNQRSTGPRKRAGALLRSGRHGLRKLDRVMNLNGFGLKKGPGTKVRRNQAINPASKLRGFVAPQLYIPVITPVSPLRAQIVRRYLCGFTGVS
jgi:hypothetical protein